MILVDTSIWIDHLRGDTPALSILLESGQCACHPFVIGELACGNLGNRREILGLLQALPALSPASHEETLFFIERHQLMGRGIGYVDSHLLAAVAIGGAHVWTRDRRLREIALEFGWAWLPETH